MMRNSRPGKYEYQYKAGFDYALGQFSPDGPGFRQSYLPEITISASTTMDIPVRQRTAI